MQIYKNPAKMQLISLSSEQNRTITVTEETEIVRQCKFVNILPISLYKSRDQKKEGTLWLMEIGNKDIHNLELCAWESIITDIPPLVSFLSSYDHFISLSILA